MVKIYTLSDPDTNQIRYIGKTVSGLSQRLTGHIFELKRELGGHKNNWLRKLIQANKKPTIELLDEVDDKDWKFWEKFYISLFRGWGFNLTNDTVGGEGFTSSQIKKLWKNKKYRQNQIDRNVGCKNPFYGKKHSEQTKSILRKKCPHYGMNHPNYGKHQTKKQKEKNKLNQPNRKPIIRMDMNSNVIDSWDGVREMCRTLNLDVSAVKRVVVGKNSHHKKFKFKFV